MKLDYLGANCGQKETLLLWIHGPLKACGLSSLTMLQFGLICSDLSFVWLKEAMIIKDKIMNLWWTMMAVFDGLN